MLTFLVEKTDKDAFRRVFFFWQDAKKNFTSNLVLVLVLLFQMYWHQQALSYPAPRGFLVTNKSHEKAIRVVCLINSPQQYHSRHTDHVIKRNDGLRDENAEQRHCETSCSMPLFENDSYCKAIGINFFYLLQIKLIFTRKVCTYLFIYFPSTCSPTMRWFLARGQRPYK